MRGGRVVVILLGLLGLWHTCEAADFTCPAGDVSCLINAINTANMNGEENTITLAAGTYTLTGVDNNTNGPNGLPSITSSLNLIGAGAEDTVIERQAGPGLDFRLLHVAGTGDVTLNQLTLRGGRLGGAFRQGAGLFNAGGSVTIIDSTVTGNSVAPPPGGAGGGGLYNAEGTVTLINSILSGNHSAGGGGGISNGGTLVLSQSTLSGNDGLGGGGGVANGGTATIVDSTFVANSVGSGARGGGIANGGPMTIMNSTFRGNTGGGGVGGGGGIFNVTAGTLEITNSTLSGNGGQVGGGILNWGALMITNSTLSDNIGGSFGGGGGIRNEGTLTITNSTLSGNSSGALGTNFGIGGGIRNAAGTLTITNSTLSDNTAGRQGGGIFSDGGSSVVTLQNTILALNASAFAPDCSAVTSLGNNLIGTTTDCDITLQPSDLIGDPGLDTFTDDGTPGNGHYPLLPTSQAIGAANDEVCPETDQIGQRRHHPCDIGAIEFPDHP